MNIITSEFEKKNEHASFDSISLETKIVIYLFIFFLNSPIIFIFNHASCNQFPANKQATTRENGNHKNTNQANARQVIKRLR